MTSELLDAFKHNAWATRRLLEGCCDLTEEQRRVSLPTGAGTVLAIMKHVIGSESYYLSLFRGSFLDWDWHEERDDTAESLLGFANDLAGAWEDLLGRPVDVEQMLTRTRSNGQVMQLKAGVVLAQALHHSSVHREQVCAILTSMGLAPPDVSAWAYGDASGDIIR